MASQSVTTRLMLTSGSWIASGSTHARGQAFDASGTLLRASQLASLFDQLRDPAGWASTAGSLNGCFAAVRCDGDNVCAAVDRLRTVPLFFATDDHSLVVSDSADPLRSALLPRASIDAHSASEFRLTGYVTGARTLIAGLQQIPAGHCLFQNARDAAPPRLLQYYVFRHHAARSESDDVLIDRLLGVHERVFRRLLADVAGRPVVVPLSGGYDSRLIGVMLRDLGYRDVLCYSYGVEGNWEARLSSELARFLGFRWTMVPYSADRWRQWAATAEFREYFRAAGNLASTPHIQDWPAVYELRARSALPSDAVFVPGHSGDFLAGSHIPRWFSARTSIGRDELIRAIFDAHYSLWHWPPGDADRLRVEFTRRIEEIVGTIEDGSPEQAADVFERWDCAERQAKFIVNSVRVYESFGFEWRLPLFDSELMDFWSRAPLGARVGRRLYFEFASRHQRLPITEANTDRAAPIAAGVRLIGRLGLRPLAKRLQYALRRIRYRRQYERSDMAWFALVDRDEFRRRYTGREIGHSFFALQYLTAIDARSGGASRSSPSRERQPT